MVDYRRLAVALAAGGAELLGKDGAAVVLTSTKPPIYARVLRPEASEEGVEFPLEACVDAERGYFEARVVYDAETDRLLVRFEPETYVTVEHALDEAQRAAWTGAAARVYKKADPRR